MKRFYAFALCAAMAGILAVIYTLLHLDWDGSDGAPRGPQPALDTQDPPPAPADPLKSRR